MMFYFPLMHQILFPSILQLQRENNFQISKFLVLIPVLYFVLRLIFSAGTADSHFTFILDLLYLKNKPMAIHDH